MDNCRTGLHTVNQPVGNQLRRGTALLGYLLRKPLGLGLRDCAQKTADPFLSHGVNSLRPSKTDGRVLSVAMDVNIQASIEAGFKRGGFLKVRHNADPLPKGTSIPVPNETLKNISQWQATTASINRVSKHLMKHTSVFSLTRALVSRILLATPFFAALLFAVVLGSNLAQAETVTRTSAFVYDADGVLVREIIEPNNASLCVATQHTLDDYGNRSATQTRNCNGSAIAGAGNEVAAPLAPPATANVSGNYAQFAARTVASSYSATTANPVAGQFPTSNTNAAGHSETQEFDPKFGTVKKLTGPNGIATTWHFDAFGRKLWEIRADTSRSFWEYTMCEGSTVCPTDIHGVAPYYFIRTGNANSSSVINSAWTRTFYDLHNRAIRTQTQIATSPTAWTLRTQDTVYDTLGRVARTSNSYLSDSTGKIAQQPPQWTYNDYDVLGRLIRERTEDPGATNTANQQSGQYVRTVAYNGLSQTSVNTKGQSTTRVNNVVGQLASVTDPQGNTITYTYDALGNQIQTNASGVISTVTYDLRGRKTAMTDPHMGTWQYRYNALGELRLQQNANGQNTTIAYDVLGRQTESREADLISFWFYDTHSSHCANAPNTAKGKLTQASTSTGYSRVHCYDSLGREVSERVAMDGNVFWSGTEYDAATGRVAKQVYPARVQPNAAPTGNTAPSAGYIVRNEYSNVALVRQLNHSTNTNLWEITGHVKNGSGHIESLTLGNGLLERFYIDAHKRASYNLTGPTETTYRQYEQYNFDSEGNLTNRRWYDFSTPSGSSSFTQNTEAFTYDNLNRLISTTGSTGVPNKTVTYNAQGNILTKDGRTYTYGTAGKPHQLTQITGSVHGASNPSYTYDVNGNILTGGGATINWTSFNMVNSMVQGSQSSTFLYGPEHQRIKQTAAYNGQNITTWYTNGFELEWNTTSNAKEVKYYIAGKIIHSETGTGATPATTQTKYLHKDHLGSVTLITSSTGAVLERYSFDAWGKRRNLDGTDYTANGGHLLGTTDRGFTGHEHLDHLGLVHMNGRIYDASLGRFMSADPFIAQTTNLQNYNRYAYVNNNPLSYTDPTGFIIKKLLKPIRPFSDQQYLNRELFKALGPKASSYAVAIGSAFCTPAGYALCAAAGSYDAARANGASSKDAFKSGLSAGVYVYGASLIGAKYKSVKGAFLPAKEAVFLHAGLGCVSAAIGGGDCERGAITGALTKMASPTIEAYTGSKTFAQRASGVAIASVVGGTISELTGDTFANGARSGAYGYLYNQVGIFAAAVSGYAAITGAVACEQTNCGATIVDAASRVWDAVVSAVDGLIYSKPDQEKDVPFLGPENGFVQGQRRGREYGSEGLPLRDYDKPHQGFPEPHVHEWNGGAREHPGRPYSPWPKE